jgi:hypothetical protein
MNPNAASSAMMSDSQRVYIRCRNRILVCLFLLHRPTAVSIGSNCQLPSIEKMFTLRGTPLFAAWNWSGECERLPSRRSSLSSAVRYRRIIPWRIPSKAYLRSLLRRERSGSFAHDLGQEIWSRTSVYRLATRPRLLRPAKCTSFRRASRQPLGRRRRRSNSSFPKAINLALRKWQRGESA